MQNRLDPKSTNVFGVVAPAKEKFLMLGEMFYVICNVLEYQVFIKNNTKLHKYEANVTR